MAKQELYRTAQQSAKLFKLIKENQELESWVQDKIVKAAEDISTVYQYLNYEKQFQDYSKLIAESTNLSESKKEILSSKLMEAKEKVKELKKKAAKEKAEKKGEKVDEDRTEVTKTQHGTATATYGADGKRKGVVHKDERKYSDEEHGEVASTAKAKSAAEKKADKEKDIKLPKHKGTTWGMKGGEKFEKTVKESDKGDMDHDGKDEEDSEEYKQNKDVAIKKAMAAKKDKKTEEGTYLGKAMAEGKKCPVCKKDPCQCGKGTKAKKVKEASEKCNHSAKGEKCPVHGLKECGMYEGSTGDYSAKKARAGKDIGKPGKNFEKIAKSAEGRGGAKVAGKVLADLRDKKKVKEAISKARDVLEGKKKGDGNLANNAKPYDKVTRGDVIAGRLGKDEEGGKKKETVKESFELDRIKSLTTRLLG